MAWVDSGIAAVIPRFSAAPGWPQDGTLLRGIAPPFTQICSEALPHPLHKFGYTTSLGQCMLPCHVGKTSLVITCTYSVHVQCTHTYMCVYMDTSVRGPGRRGLKELHPNMDTSVRGPGRRGQKELDPNMSM
eukprot:354674-Chlamydomonas_euryale.AAC.2